MADKVPCEDEWVEFFKEVAVLYHLDDRAGMVQQFAGMFHQQVNEGSIFFTPLKEDEDWYMHIYGDWPDADNPVAILDRSTTVKLPDLLEKVIDEVLGGTRSHMNYALRQFDDAAALLRAEMAKLEARGLLTEDDETIGDS